MDTNVIIQGTYKQHLALLIWADEYNEKIKEFCPKVTFQIHAEDLRDIIIMPEHISNWMVFNCHLSFVRDFYLEYYNITEIPYGEELPNGQSKTNH